eukprot:scpid87181/ scgid13171/ 
MKVWRRMFGSLASSQRTSMSGIAASGLHIDAYALQSIFLCHGLCMASPVLCSGSMGPLLCRQEACWGSDRQVSGGLYRHHEVLICLNDAALYTTSLSHLQTMTNEFVSCASSWGLTVSVQKTKAMAVNCSDPPPSIDLQDGGSVEVVDSFTYLGSVLSADSALDKELTSPPALPRPLVLLALSKSQSSGVAAYPSSLSILSTRPLSSLPSSMEQRLGP